MPYFNASGAPNLKLMIDFINKCVFDKSGLEHRKFGSYN